MEFNIKKALLEIEHVKWFVDESLKSHHDLKYKRVLKKIKPDVDVVLRRMQKIDTTVRKYYGGKPRYGK